ncbi:MAG TPA: secretin N-terminal domain-containing protein [Acidobacteriota bacterium]|nr:secretin N-terminal domain-containing protein [Acidobacteriota bacterium]
MSRMRLWLVVAIVAFLAASNAFPQNEQPAPKKAPEQQVRVVEVKYADPAELAEVLSPFTRTNLAFVVPSRGLKTLTLSGSPEIVTAMEEIIRKLDVAHPQPQSKSIEVTAYLLAASESGSSAMNLPAPLDPVLKQLRSTFAYKSFQLLETIVGRSATVPNSNFSASGFIPNPTMPGGDPRIPYDFGYRTCRLTHDEKGDSIHLDELSLSLQYKERRQSAEGQIVTGSDHRGFQTNLDLRPGQMVVVGKTNFQVGTDALIAVISAKVVD